MLVQFSSHCDLVKMLRTILAAAVLLGLANSQSDTIKTCREYKST